MRRVLEVMLFCALVSCASAPKPQAQGSAPEALATAGQKESFTFSDPVLGFQISRPHSDEWRFTSAEGMSSDMVKVPVIIAHRDTGSQVVVQVAPAIATAGQFANRLTEGLRARPGFKTTEPTPIPLADGAVGFDFSLGEKVLGRVSVLEGSGQHVFVLLSTWPMGVSKAVLEGIDQIEHSLHPVPPT